MRLSREEAKANRDAGGDGQAEQATGSAIGTVLGGGLGALGFLVPGLGAVTMPLGASLGGAAGSAIGGAVGRGNADSAQEKAGSYDLARQKRLGEYQARQAALEAFLSRGR